MDSGSYEIIHFSLIPRRDDTAVCETEVSNSFSFEDGDGKIERKIWDVIDLKETGLLEMHIPLSQL